MADSHWNADELLTGSWRGATSTLLSRERHHIVVDTGLPHEAHQLVGALESRGLRPDDIESIINTHFHVDHVLNNCLFPSSTIYAPQQSFDWCCSLYSALRSEDGWEDAALRYYPETLEEARFVENMGKLRNFALRWWDAARLGARSQYRWMETEQIPDGLECLFTSGHVPGHASIIVHGLEQQIVIAGDALLSREHDDQVLTMIPHNRAQYHEDRARILALGGYVIPGHDQGFCLPPSATGQHPTVDPAAK